MEELFNAPEFEGRGNGSVTERLLNDKRIKAVEKMLKDGKAELHFLGSVTELAGLRHELSFAFIVHDGNYQESEENRFIANEECSRGIVHSIPIQDIDNQSACWENINVPSVAMWYMFQNTDIYKSLIHP